MDTTVAPILATSLLLAACASDQPTLRKGQPARALSAGSTPVKAIDGKPIEIKELARRGPVMLVFLRGFS